MDHTYFDRIKPEEALTRLESEHESLIFPGFDCNAAFRLGMYLVRKARRENKAVAIDITVGRHQVFHCALEGTDWGNDRWIKRKSRVASKFKKSSYYIGTLLKLQNQTIEEAYGLSADRYAPFGGSYPIITGKDGFIGTITVSGLPDHEDHEMVVDAIRWYLGRAQAVKKGRAIQRGPRY